MFEAKLNEIQWDGIGIGSLLSNEICVQLLLNNQRPTWRNIPLIAYQYIRAMRFRTPLLNFVVHGEIPPKYGLITSILAKANYLNQVLAVSAELKRNTEIRYLLYDSKPSDLNTTIDSTISRISGNGEFASEWKKKFKRIEAEVWNTLFDKDINLTFPERLNFFVLLLTQTQRLYQAIKFLKKNPPDFVLSEYDKNAEMVTVVAAASSLGIPSYSLLHGLITYPEPYIPIVADRIFVWGDFFKEYLIGKGLPEKFITVTGAPHLGPIENDLPLEERVYITLATNPYNQSMMTELADIFCQSINELKKKIPKIKGMVRIHHAEDFTAYQCLMERFPEIVFDNGKQFSFIESIRVSRICVTYNSAYGVDSLLSGRLVVQLAEKVEDSFFCEMVSRTGLKRVANQKELIQYIQKYWNKSNDISLGARKMMCSEFGKQAALNIANDLAIHSHA